MNAAELCEKYREALSKKDLLAIQALFTPDATVTAPISGTASVGQFHAYLFSHTKQTVAQFPNVLSYRDKPSTVTLQFSYTFLVAASGDLAVLDGITVFEMDEALGKFKGLTVIYNSSDLRDLMERADIPLPATAAGS